MSYIEKNLMPGEAVIYRGKVHWAIYLTGMFLIALGVAAITSEKEMAAFGSLMVLAGLGHLIKSLITKISTELAVTDKRVIAKFGFIKRVTMELNHGKVESISVDQGIIQRILNAGTISVQGTGGGKTPIPNIDDPLIFRKKAMEAIDKNQR